MRLAVVSLTLASVALAVGLLAQPTDRAAADYNVAGQWIFDFGGGPCPGTISLTLGVPPNDDASAVITCSPDAPIIVSGPLNTSTRALTLSGTVGSFGLVFMQGTVSPDGHTIAGIWSANVSPFGGSFTASGGDGEAKPGQPTFTATPTATATPITPTVTPPPVGGISLDAPARSGDAIDAWWLIAIASASFALGGAALFARSRRASA